MEDGRAEEMQAICHKKERKCGLWQGERDMGAGGSLLAFVGKKQSCEENFFPIEKLPSATSIYD